MSDLSFSMKGMQSTGISSHWAVIHAWAIFMQDWARDALSDGDIGICCNFNLSCKRSKLHLSNPSCYLSFECQNLLSIQQQEKTTKRKQNGWSKGATYSPAAIKYQAAPNGPSTSMDLVCARPVRTACGESHGSGVYDESRAPTQLAFLVSHWSTALRWFHTGEDWCFAWRTTRRANKGGYGCRQVERLEELKMKSSKATRLKLLQRSDEPTVHWIACHRGVPVKQ